MLQLDTYTIAASTNIAIILFLIISIALISITTIKKIQHDGLREFIHNADYKNPLALSLVFAALCIRLYSSPYLIKIKPAEDPTLLLTLNKFVEYTFLISETMLFLALALIFWPSAQIVSRYFFKDKSEEFYVKATIAFLIFFKLKINIISITLFHLIV